MEADRFLAGCTGNGGRHCRLKAPRIWTRRWRGSPGLRSQNPPGYRDWRLISVAHEAGNLNDFRAILGNDIAIKAYREEKLPFPDGTIIARLAWSYIPSEENNKVFGRAQSFVAGPPNEWFSSWSRTQKNTPRQAAGDCSISKTANLPTRQCTKPALLALPRARQGSGLCLYPLRTLI